MGIGPRAIAVRRVPCAPVGRLVSTFDVSRHHQYDDDTPALLVDRPIGERLYLVRPSDVANVVARRCAAESGKDRRSSQRFLTAGRQV